MIEKVDVFRAKLVPPTLTDTAKEVLAALENPPGRFRLPKDYLLKRKIKSLMYSFIDSNEVSRPLFSRKDGWTATWQPLIDLLYTRGFLGDRKISNVRFRHDSPCFYSYLLKGPDYANRDVKGVGISDSPEEALSKAVGELIERSVTAKLPSKQIFKPQNQLSTKKILDINSLNGFLEWQRALFPQYGATPDDILSWSKCKNITDNKNILVPTQLVSWGNHYEKERKIVHPTTSGSGGYFSREGAIVSSIYESVQRDGFFIFWLNKIAPPLIKIDSVHDGCLTKLIEYFLRYKFEIYLLDTTSDIPIPSCTCVLLDAASGHPRMYVGAGTNLDPVQAIRQSMLESYSVSGVQARSVQTELPSNYKPFRDNSINRAERLNLWQGKTMLKRFEFFISGPETSFDDFKRNGKEFPSGNETLAYLISMLRTMGAGYEIIVREVGDEILRQVGYHVVKTVIPRLFPLYLNESMPTLGSERLRTVPEKLGYKISGELNPWPHPFP